MGQNKKQKILFACSLVSRKFHFDGERRKSTDIYKILCRNYRVTVCNFTKNRLVQLLKFILFILFHRKTFIFVAKSPSGGNILLKILRLLKYDRNKIAFYTYGKGFRGEFADKVEMKNINYAKTIICESESVKRELICDGVTSNILIFPCVKHIFKVSIPQYEEKKVLRCAFIARILRDKGLIDLVDVLEDINKDELKIFAMISGGNAEIDVEEYIKNAQSKRKDIQYLGTSFSLNTLDDYQYLASFDFHIFPTKYFAECIPGSAIDSFIAGLPTLTSEYDSAREVFNDNLAFFFKFNSKDDLKEKLLYLYEHQKELYDKRCNCLKEAEKYSEESFELFFNDLMRSVNLDLGRKQ